MVSFKPWQLDRKFGGPKSWYECCGEKNTSLLRIEAPAHVYFSSYSEKGGRQWRKLHYEELCNLQSSLW
jgi:hypothetical protein